MRNLGRW